MNVMNIILATNLQANNQLKSNGFQNYAKIKSKY